MIDIHCHLSYGVDDGPSTFAESVKMLEEAARCGIETIIATPHYQENVFEANKAEEILREVKLEGKKYGIKVIQGYENFYVPTIAWLMKDRKRMTLHDTEYILLEFPFNAKPKDCTRTIDRLVSEQIVPILAHPERYRNFTKGFPDFLPLIKAGCLIQIDVASILGVYGLKVKSFARHLIDLKLVDFVASNAHNARDYCEWYGSAYQKVLQWAGEEYTASLFKINAEKLILKAKSDPPMLMKLQA